MLTQVKHSAKRLLRRIGAFRSPAEPRPRLPIGSLLSQSLIHEIFEQVRPYTMTSRERIEALCQAVAHLEAERIPGAIVECGVWRGGSMMAAALTLRHLRARRHIYLFDTFTGMTPPEEVDRDLTGRHANALLAGTSSEAEHVRARCPLEYVRRALAGTGVDPDHLHFVQGPVEETLPDAAPDAIALLRLDTDWYGSTRHELECLSPRLSTFGILIIDDYGHWQGARRAVDEFIARRELPWRLHEIDYTARLVVAPPARQMLNIGCGKTSHPAWHNLDLQPRSGGRRYDARVEPLPFPDGGFDVVYHSHLLEHLPHERALPFLTECRRVLKPNGLLRMAAPDLEKIARSYLKNLDDGWRGDDRARERHAWLRLELFDQMVREQSGGAMIDAIKNADAETRAFVVERLGAEAKSILQQVKQPKVEQPPAQEAPRSLWQRLFTNWRERWLRWVLGSDYESLQLGRFRRGGEVHLAMYDRLALRDLLAAAGFRDIRCVEADESAIPGWKDFHLDTEPDGAVRKPDSLFMEATRDA